MLKIELPYPPSSNTLYPSNRKGRRFLSTKGQKYAHDVYYICKQLRIKPILGRIEEVIEVYPPDNRIRDIMNVEKAINDSLKKAEAFKDDSQIDYLTLIRKETVKNGKVVVILDEVAPKPL